MSDQFQLSVNLSLRGAARGYAVGDGPNSDAQPSRRYGFGKPLPLQMRLHKPIVQHPWRCPANACRTTKG